MEEGINRGVSQVVKVRKPIRRTVVLRENTVGDVNKVQIICDVTYIRPFHGLYGFCGMESRELGLRISIYEGSRRIVLPHEDKSVPPMRNPFCCLFFREWIKDLHDLLMEKTPSLFMLLGCSSIFISSLTSWSTRLGFLSWITNSVEISEEFVLLLYILRRCRYLRPCVWYVFFWVMNW